KNSSDSAKLYFFDLLGAGAGALVFFPLLGALGPLRSLIALSVLALVSASFLLGFEGSRRKRMIGGLFVMALFEAGLMLLPEPVYEIDRAIGWEWIPGNFAEDE